MTRKTAAVVVLAAAGFAAGACGSSAPPSVHVHGTFDYSGLTGDVGCAQQGEQVKITDAAGKVLATPLLGARQAKTIRTSGVAVSVMEFPYSATVPAESRYAVTIGGKAPYYVSQAKFRKGIDLGC